MRLANSGVLVTGTGTWLGRLDSKSFVEVGMDGAFDVEGPRPTKEAGMHLAVYRERPDVKVCIHCSSPYAMLLACQRRLPQSELFVESLHYLKRVGSIDYFQPGSNELAEAVGLAARNLESIVMFNHGAMVVGSSVKDALMRTLTLEMASRFTLISEGGLKTVHSIDKSQVAEFYERNAYGNPR